MDKGETQLNMMEFIWQGCSAYREGCRNCIYLRRCPAFYDTLIDKPPLVTPRIAIEYMNRDILSKLRVQYAATGKKEKTVIIDTLCSIFGYGREYAQYKLMRGG